MSAEKHSWFRRFHYVYFFEGRRSAWNLSFVANGAKSGSLCAKKRLSLSDFNRLLEVLQSVLMVSQTNFCRSHGIVDVAGVLVTILQGSGKIFQCLLVLAPIMVNDSLVEEFLSLRQADRLVFLEARFADT